MHAIIKDGGKQYTVSPGKIIEIEKRDLPTGKTVEFPEVIYYHHKDDVRIGKPTLENVKVEGVVEKHLMGPKVTIFFFRAKEDSQRKRGHRQQYTAVRISKITAK